SGRISFNRRANPSGSSIWESSAFQLALFSRNCSSLSPWYSCSSRLICSTIGRSRRTSRWFFEPRAFLIIQPTITTILLLASRSGDRNSRKVGRKPIRFECLYLKLKQTLEPAPEIRLKTTAAVNNATHCDDLAALTFHNVNRLPDFAAFGYYVLRDHKALI